MNNIKHLYQVLTDFLNTKAGRQEVVDWYDQLSVNSTIEESKVQRIQSRAKDRVLARIRMDTKRRSLGIFYRVAAAAAVIICGYFSWNYFAQPQLATDEQLAQIAPAKQKAIIVLADGKEIDLDQLVLNQSVTVGEIIITKDDQGKISYHNAKDGSKRIQPNILRIPKAATYQLTLVDGTRVTLNSDSKLTYPSSFGTGDRVVEIEGEAYFEVARTSNKSRFIVQAKSQRIEVLGTKFNIRAYADEQKEQTTLAEGVVQVTLDRQKVMLKPSQQASTSEGKLIMEAANLDKVLSWTEGQFYFDGTNTKEVLEEIARWYDIDIDYSTRVSVQYKGKIPRNLSLDKLIQLLNYAELRTKAVIGDNKRINLIIT